MNKKLLVLKKILKKLSRVLVAYSGGVDSTLLLKVALDTLGRENVLAVVAVSKTYPASEKKFAIKTAKKLGADFQLLKTNELTNPSFVKNPPERCFYCKDELFKKLTKIAKKKNMKVVDGSNYSDITDFRPGARAAKKWGVISPLKEAKLTKQEIREFSKALKLPTHNKPSQACLSSRFPYGEEINKKKLSMVEKAEGYLKKFGFNNLRVRFSPNNTARIEVDVRDLKKLVDENNRKRIISTLKKIGFLYITVDIEGFRSGSQNLIFHRRT